MKHILTLSVAAFAAAACATKPAPPPVSVSDIENQPVIVTQVAKICDAEDLEVYFARGETEISDIAQTAIDAFGARYSSCDYRIMEIEGHTDAVGDAETNLVFSKQRAEIVLQALEVAGIDATRIRIIPYGERQALEADGDIQPMNRKTVVRVIN